LSLCRPEHAAYLKTAPAAHRKACQGCPSCTSCSQHTHAGAAQASAYALRLWRHMSRACSVPCSLRTRAVTGLCVKRAHVAGRIKKGIVSRGLQIVRDAQLLREGLGQGAASPRWGVIHQRICHACQGLQQAAAAVTHHHQSRPRLPAHLRPDAVLWPRCPAACCCTRTQSPPLTRSAATCSPAGRRPGCSWPCWQGPSPRIAW
jgi:hypothetical protein